MMENMAEKLMTIREMCDTYEVTARTLRFYEAKELLFPIREGQKRLFTKRDRARLKLILRGKRFGFSLEKIRQLLDLYDNTDVGRVAQIEATIGAAQNRMDEMKTERDGLEKAIGELEGLIDRGRELLAEIENKKKAG